MGIEIGIGALVFAAGSTAAIIIDTAIVGAVIGGLTSAVMGGDIGKGMLFGAVGGAVLGGIGGITGNVTSMFGAGAAGTGASVGFSGAEMAVTGLPTTTATTGIAATEVAAMSAPIAGSGGWLNSFFNAGTGSTMAKQIGVSAVGGMAKGMLQADVAEEQTEAQKEIYAKQNEEAFKRTKYQVDRQLEFGREELAEDRRQFEEGRKDYKAYKIEKPSETAGLLTTGARVTDERPI